MWNQRFASSINRPADRLLFRTTLDEEVSALSMPFTDGSGLVLLSSALVSLVTNLIDLAVIRKTRADVPDADNDSGVDFVTAAIRYHLLQMRCFGLSAQVPRRSDLHDLTFVDHCNMCAQAFIVGHESAHFVLGHTTKPFLSTSPVSTLTCALDSVDQEREADSLGLRVAEASLEEKFGDEARLMSVVGAIVAITAIEIVEHGYLVQRAQSHPPVMERLASILIHCTQVQQRQIDEFLGPVRIATERAIDFTQMVRHEAWQTIITDPVSLGQQLRSDWGEYIGNMEELDRLHAFPRDKLVDGLDRVARSRGLDFSEGLDALRRERLQEAYRIFGVKATLVPLLVDPLRSLGFSTIRAALQESAAMRTIEDETPRMMIAVGVARLIQYCCLNKEPS
jgi:hypothetical protein